MNVVAKGINKTTGLPTKKTLHVYGRNGRSRTHCVKIVVSLDTDLADWLKDRATMEGVSLALLCRDALALWSNLIRDEEIRQKADYEVSQPPRARLRSHTPGYIDRMTPGGFTGNSHLDDTPLGINEFGEA